MYDHNGERVSPEDVLDAEELGDYYRQHGWPRTDRMLAWPPRDVDDDGPAVPVEGASS